MAQADRDTRIEVLCRFCDGEFTFRVDACDVEAWRSGTYVQDAFPYLSINQRELLKTATCGKCWDKIFPDDE